nr:unnamed protein product [Callosobruchus analis]
MDLDALLRTLPPKHCQVFIKLSLQNEFLDLWEHWDEESWSEKALPGIMEKQFTWRAFVESRRLSRSRVKLDRVVFVIISSAVLLNISEYLNNPVPVNEQEDDINGEEEEEYNSETEDENVRRRRLQRRVEIKNLIYQLPH